MFSPTVADTAMYSRVMFGDCEFVLENLSKPMRYAPGYGESQIRTALMRGAYRAMGGWDGDDRVGFIVYSIEDTGSDRVFYVHAGWHKDRWLERDAFDSLSNSVDRLAESLGCSRIEFKTIFRGWLRRLKRYGYEATTYINISKTIGEEHGRR